MLTADPPPLARDLSAAVRAIWTPRGGTHSWTSGRDAASCEDLVDVMPGSASPGSVSIRASFLERAWGQVLAVGARGGGDRRFHGYAAAIVDVLPTPRWWSITSVRSDSPPGPSPMCGGSPRARQRVGCRRRPRRGKSRLARRR